MKYIFWLFVGVIAISCTEKKEGQDDNGAVNIYSHRHYETDQMLFDKFTEQTGIKVNVVSASADELIKRLELEGEKSPADVLITVDAGRLHRAKSLGLLQGIESSILSETIKPQFKDSEGHWFGLTYRARIIAYAKDRVNPDDIQNYEDMADPQFKGKVVMRSSENIYNQSLLAAMVAHHGEEVAMEWAEGVVKNLARSPRGNDRDQVKAIAAGAGDLSLVNTYYLGHMAESESEEERLAVSNVGIIFPNQNSTGTHINISGAGVAKHAPNKENAIKFLEFMVSDEAQKAFAEANYEYPVKEGTAWSETATSWGQHQIDTLKLEKLGINNEVAVRIFDKAGWK